MSDECEKYKNLLKINLEKLSSLEYQIRQIIYNINVQKEFITSILDEKNIHRTESGIYVTDMPEDPKIIHFPNTKAEE